MATQSSVGHGMRRRSGAPSNYLEAGPSMSRMHPTSDEHHAAAASAGSHRIAIGTADSTYAATPAPALEGTLVPRKNTQAMDPTAGGKANRANIEVIGASYRVQPKSTYVQLDPSAGPTMANARLLPTVVGNTDNFGGGVQASTL